MANGQRSSTCSAAILSASSGFTLTEVVIAILLTGIIVTGTFSAILVTKKTPEVATNRVIAAMAQRQLLETLQNYQTANYGTVGNNCALNANPNDFWCKGPNGNWALPGDTCRQCSGSTCGCNAAPCAGGPGCYALQPGCTHDVTNLLPAFMTGTPYVAKMCYTVADTGPGGQENSRPEVTVQLIWNESQE